MKKEVHYPQLPADVVSYDPKTGVLSIKCPHCDKKHEVIIEVEKIKKTEA